MSMIIDGTSGVTFPNSTVQASAGKIIQVVSATSSTNVSTTNTSSGAFVTTQLAGSITPKFSTSTILVMINAYLSPNRTAGATGTDFGLGVRVYNQASTAVFAGSATPYSAQYLATDATISTGYTTRMLQSFSFIDSPATTSTQTYTLYMAPYKSTASINIDTGDVSSIILMEIAA